MSNLERVADLDEPSDGAGPAPRGAEARRAGRRLPPRRRIAVGLVRFGPALFVCVAGWLHRWMTDDGFIYLRVVEQLSSGNGPVFNAGERIEVYTGTLWVAVLTVVDLLLPFRSEWVSVVTSLLLTGLGVALATVGAARLWRRADRSGRVVPVGAAVFASVYPVWVFTTSGLENGLAYAWIGACTLALATWAGTPGRPLRARSAVLLGLGWLIRPELVLVSACMLLAVAAAELRSGGWRRTLRTAAAAVALPAAYQLFRMGYFGSILPNTGIAKEGGRLNPERGLRYLRDFAGPYLLLLPAAVLAVGAYVPLLAAAAGRRDRRTLAAVLGMVAGGALCAGYIVAVGGDYHHGRLFLPSLLVLLAPVAAIPVPRLRARAGWTPTTAVRGVAVAAVAVWCLVAVTTLRPIQLEQVLANGVDTPREFGAVTAEDAGGQGLDRLLAAAGQHEVIHEPGIGRWGPPAMEVDPSLPRPYAALQLVGVWAYALGTDWYVHDLYGLADTLTGHLELPPPTGGIFPVAGHEKPLPFPWVAAVLSAPGSDVEPPPKGQTIYELHPQRTGARFDEDVAWARATLRCGPVRDLYEAARAPLGPGRILANIRGSVANARLRIPPDPREAYRSLCGDGTPPEVRDLRQSGRPPGA